MTDWDIAYEQARAAHVEARALYAVSVAARDDLAAQLERAEALVLAADRITVRAHDLAVAIRRVAEPHHPNPSNKTRCVCGGEVVFFQDNFDSGPDGYGCEFVGYPTPAFGEPR